MEISGTVRRAAFIQWLRTGYWPPVRTGDGTELKFNPYHDPHNGQFTFAPGGTGGSAGFVHRSTVRAGGLHSDIHHHTAVSARPAAAIGEPPEPSMRRGGNSRAFDIPMTLEQAFPGLDNTPAGAAVAAAGNLFDIWGPATEMTTEVLQTQSRTLQAQIRLLDPTWHYRELGPVTSVAGLTNKVDDLLFQRAAVMVRVSGDYRPLQVETLRFIQQRADRAYDTGMALIKAGRLRVRLSEREALGNYIDAKVRVELRERYSQLDIDSAGKGPVRVNRRENDSSSELTYRRPDARVKNAAFDVTLTEKTLKTSQIRGFFNTDFRPDQVVIIRPSQVGPNHTYAISREELKR